MTRQPLILADTRVKGNEDRVADYQLYVKDVGDIGIDLLIRSCNETNLQEMAQLAMVTDNCLGLLLLRDPESLHRSQELEQQLTILKLPVVEVFLEGLGTHERIDQPGSDRKIIRTIYGRRHRAVFWAAHFIKHCQDYPYRTFNYGDEDSHTGDLFLPAGNGPYPVVMLIHGGFWRDGYYRDSMHGLAADLAKSGFAVWNIEYRRVGPSGGGYPESHQDILQALNYLLTLQQHFPLDLGRVAVAGHSAGGYLALWGSSIPAGVLAVQMPVPAIGVKLGISMAGVTDLDEAYKDGGGEQAASHFLKSAADQPELRRQLSVGYLQYDPATHLVIAHGTNDDYVPVELSQYTFELMQERGLDCELLILPGMGHNEFVDPDAAPWREIARRIGQVLHPDQFLQ